MREFLLPYGKETLKAEIEEEHLAGVLVSELHDYKAPMERTQLVQEALEYGNVSGWLCVQGRGAIPSLPTRQEIERHLV